MVFSPSNSGTAIRRLDIEETFRQFDVEMNINNLIWQRILPIKTVDFPRFTYKRLKIEELTQLVATARASGAPYNDFRYTYDEVEDKTEDHGLATPIDDREAAIADYNSRNFKSDAEAAQLTRQAVLMSHEARVAAAVEAAGTTTAASALWTTASTNIRTDVRDGKLRMLLKTGKMPNALLVSDVVLEYMLDNTDFKDTVKGQNFADARAGATARNISALAQYLNIDEIIPFSARYNTKNKGATPVLGSIWTGTKAHLVRISRGDSLAVDPGLGKTFAYIGDGGQPAGTVEEWTEPGIRGRKVRVRHDVKAHISWGEFVQSISGVAA